MRKSEKLGSYKFFHLTDNSLYYETLEGSNIYNFPFEMKENVLDFSISDNGHLKVFTKDGQAVVINVKKNSIVSNVNFSQKFYNASICKDEILAIKDQVFAPVLLNFDGKVMETYTDISKKVRFCIFTTQLQAVADSSLLYIKKVGNDEWKRYKYREFYITNLFNVNRNTEFGLTTPHNTRIFRKHFQSVFRSWAQNTVCLLQCPCRKHFYAHLDADGLLRVGDNEGEYSIQENQVSGICWDMGMLWARSKDGKWSKVALTHEDQIFDLRATHLNGLEAPLAIKDNGKVIDILETLIERPALSQEIMRVLPPIAQQLKNGIIVREAQKSLETYINKYQMIEEVIGQIGMIVDGYSESH